MPNRINQFCTKYKKNTLPNNNWFMHQGLINGMSISVLEHPMYIKKKLFSGVIPFVLIFGLNTATYRKICQMQKENFEVRRASHQREHEIKLSQISLAIAAGKYVHNCWKITLTIYLFQFSSFATQSSGSPTRGSWSQWWQLAKYDQINTQFLCFLQKTFIKIRFTLGPNGSTSWVQPATCSLSSTAQSTSLSTLPSTDSGSSTLPALLKWTQWYILNQI